MAKASRKLNYGDLLAASRDASCLLRLEAANEFDERPYATETYDLSKEGLPWIPVVGWRSLQRFEAPTPWHTHRDCVEFVCCRRGVFEYEGEGTSHRLTPGGVFVSRPDEPHRQVADPRGGTLYSLMVSCRPDVLARSGFSSAERTWMIECLAALPRCYGGGKEVLSLFHSLFMLLKATEMPRPERRLRLREAALRLVLDLLDGASRGEPRATSARVKELAEAMRLHPERAVSLDELVARLGLSTSGVLNAFKAETGFSPHAWLLKCRIERAKSELARGRGVEEVSRLLGFNSRQHLTLQFRKIAGCSPREWLSGRN